MTMKSAALGLALLAGLTCGDAALADVTYFYTGNDYSSAIAPYTTSDKITGSVTFSAPLAANTGLTYYLPTAFSLSDGVQTLSYSNTIGSDDTFIFGTDAAGNINQWFVLAAATVGGIPLQSILTSSFLGDVGLSAVAVPGSFVAAFSAEPGSWTTTTAVPELSTWLFMTIGFAGLAGLGVRKKAAAVG